MCKQARRAHCCVLPKQHLAHNKYICLSCVESPDSFVCVRSLSLSVSLSLSLSLSLSVSLPVSLSLSLSLSVPPQRLRHLALCFVVLVLFFLTCLTSPSAFCCAKTDTHNNKQERETNSLSSVCARVCTGLWCCSTAPDAPFPFKGKGRKEEGEEGEKDEDEEEEEGKKRAGGVVAGRGPSCGEYPRVHVRLGF